MNPDRWPSWAPQISGVQYGEPRLRAETSGRVEGPLCVRIDFEVLAVDEDHWTWTWKAWWQYRLLALTLTHGVASRPNGSRTWLTISGSPALVIPYAPVTKLALMNLVRD